MTILRRPTTAARLFLPKFVERLRECCVWRYRLKTKGAMAPLREPNKLQRLSEAVVTSLPYHPEFIDQGTVFDAALLEPVSVLAPVQPDSVSRRTSGSSLWWFLLRQQVCTRGVG
jgi:hypothetical protein